MSDSLNLKLVNEWLNNSVISLLYRVYVCALYSRKVEKDESKLQIKQWFEDNDTLVLEQVKNSGKKIHILDVKYHKTGGNIGLQTIFSDLKEIFLLAKGFKNIEKIVLTYNNDLDDEIFMENESAVFLQRTDIAEIVSGKTQESYQSYALIIEKEETVQAIQGELKRAGIMELDVRKFFDKIEIVSNMKLPAMKKQTLKRHMIKSVEDIKFDYEALVTPLKCGSELTDYFYDSAYKIYLTYFHKRNELYVSENFGDDEFQFVDRCNEIFVHENIICILAGVDDSVVPIASVYQVSFYWKCKIRFHSFN